MQGFLHTQSRAPHKDFYTYRAQRHAGISAHAEGFLSEIKADSRRNGLLLLVASATEMAEQNKQANEVPTLYFLALCSTSYSCGCDEFSLELRPKPQLFLSIIVLHKC